ncbi:helix-turn-helix transcriptional regulator [Ruminococcaceae bacterium OttesenSCG-928-L11]|nr:helix-turn-helix transcriptional regulator [Ruminococcaceae bacterium OttesenSCG-928-L11]
MDTRAAVANRIEELCNERGITINALSYISGVANSTIKGIFYQRSKNPGIVTIKKICDGLEISLAQFFDTEIFNRLDQEIK